MCKKNAYTYIMKQIQIFDIYFYSSGSVVLQGSADRCTTGEQDVKCN